MKRVPLRVDMTIGEVAKLAAEDFLLNGSEVAVADVVLEVDGKRMICVRFEMSTRDVAGLSDPSILPSTPRH